MADGFYFEIAFIVLLILLSGVFAAAEITVVTASRGRLQGLAEAGDRPPSPPCGSRVIPIASWRRFKSESRRWEPSRLRSVA
jgi:hypothetical protein